MTDIVALVLNATTRQALKKQVQQLRDRALVPGVVYGHHITNTPVQVQLKQLRDVYRQSGDSALIDLVIDEKTPVKALIQDLSYDILTDRIQHVDFHVVNMEEAIHTEIQLQFTGMAPAVKELGGVLLKNKDKINIKCLPQDLIKEFTVDISVLKTFENSITVQDLHFPEKITVLDQANDIVAKVTPPRSDEELASLNQSVQEDVSKVAGVIKEPTAETKDKDKTATGAKK